MEALETCFLLGLFLGVWAGYKVGKWRGLRLVRREDIDKVKAVYRTRRDKYL